jgi:hypothetical protein
MTLDDLREELRASDARAEKSVRLNATKLREKGLRKASSAMRRLQAWLWAELLLSAVAVLWLGSFEAAHWREPKLSFAALPLHVVAVGHVVFGAFQLVAVRRLDFGAPVVAIQRELEGLRAGRIRMTKWTLLLGPLLWVPLLVVTLEGLFGIDAYAVFDHAWLVTNLLFGVAFAPAMVWLSRRFGDRFCGSPLLQRLLRDLAGYNLAVAQAFLGELARFEAEDEPA